MTMPTEWKTRLENLLVQISHDHEKTWSAFPTRILLDFSFDPEVISELRNFITQPRKRIFLFKFSDQSNDYDPDLALEAQLSFLNHHALAAQEKATVHPLKIAFNRKQKLKHPIQFQEYWQEELVNFTTPFKRKFYQSSRTPFDLLSLGHAGSSFFSQAHVHRPQQSHTHKPQEDLQPPSDTTEHLVLPLSKERIKKMHPRLDDRSIDDLLSGDEQKIRTYLFKQCQAYPSYQSIKVLLNQKPKLIFLWRDVYLYAGLTYLNQLSHVLLQSFSHQNQPLKCPLEQDQDALNQILNPQNLKHLKKAVYFSEVERSWWNQLIALHHSAINKLTPVHETKNLSILAMLGIFHDKFLGFLQDHHLTLPTSCLIQDPRFLNTVVDHLIVILKKSCSPQDQLQALNQPDINLHGAYLACKAESSCYRFIHSSMELDETEQIQETPENLKTRVQQALEQGSDRFLPLMHRWLGMHWHSNFSYDILEQQWQKILQNSSFSRQEQHQLVWVLAQCLQHPTIWMPQSWILGCQRLIQRISQAEPLSEHRIRLLNFVTCNHQFHDPLDLDQLTLLLRSSSHDLDAIQTCLMSPEEGSTFFYEVKSRLLQENLGTESQLYPKISSFLERYAKWKKILIAKFPTIPWRYFQMLLLMDAQLTHPQDLDHWVDTYSQLQNKTPILANNILVYLAQFNLHYSFEFPKISNIHDILNYFLKKDESIFNQSVEGVEAQLQSLSEPLALPAGCCFGFNTIHNVDEFLTQAFCQCFIDLKEHIKIKKIRDDVIKLTPMNQGDYALSKLEPFFTQIENIFKHTDSSTKEFKQIVHDIRVFDETRERMFAQDFSILGLGGKGEHLLQYILLGTKHPNQPSLNLINQKLLDKFHKITEQQIEKTCKNPTKLFYWFRRVLETQSLLFMFEEEVIQRRVVPTFSILLRRLLDGHELEKLWLKQIQHAKPRKNIEESMLQYACDLKSFHQLIEELSTWKHGQSAEQFIKMMALIQRLRQHPGLNDHHLLTWLTLMKPFQNDDDFISFYLLTWVELCEVQPQSPSSKDLDHALQSLQHLIHLSDKLSKASTYFKKFYRTTLSFVLAQQKPFPMNALMIIHESVLPETTKNLLLQNYLDYLACVSSLAEDDLLPRMIDASIQFLLHHPEHIFMHRIWLHPRTCTEPCVFIMMLSRFNQLPSHAPWMSIISRLSQQDKPLLQTTLNALVEQLVTQHKNGTDSGLEAIRPLFDFTPIPTASKVLQWIQLTDDMERSTALRQFDLNPHGCKPSRPSHELNIEKCTQYIQDTQMLYPQAPEQAQELRAQLEQNYIRLHDGALFQELRNASRTQIQQWMCSKLEDFRHKQLVFQLHDQEHRDFFALLLEIYFRCTGLELNETQILALMTALHQDRHALMRIKTGEGKSLIAPLLAVLSYTQGGEVCLLTANRELLQRDYEHYAQSFFDFLKIPSFILHSNSPLQLAPALGILCTTLEDMILYQMRWEETYSNETPPHPMHIILDECDDALLDKSSIHFKLVKKNQKASGLAWIYPWINEFIQNDVFLNTQSEQAWDEDDDAEQLKLFLLRKLHEDEANHNFIKAQSQAQFTAWITAALHAQMLKRDRDFVIQSTTHEGKPYKIAVPLHQGFPKTGCWFGEGIQEALHARLNHEASSEDQASYALTERPKVLRQTTATRWIQTTLKRNGRLLGISGTLGTAQELEELHRNFDCHAYLIPEQRPDLKQTYPPKFCWNTEQNKDLIQDIIDPLAVSDTQPILIMMEHMDDVKALGHTLTLTYAAQGFHVQTITGEESYEDKVQKINRAGLTKTITLSTAMLARGTDIDPGDHRQGLLVLQTYPEHARGTMQIQGRAARQGQPGAWIPLYQIQPPVHWFWRLLYRLFQSYRNYYHQKSLHAIHQSLELQLQQDRQWSQRIDGLYQQWMQPIQRQEKIILGQQPSARNRLMELRIELHERFQVLEQTYLSVEKNEMHLQKFEYALQKLKEQYQPYYDALIPSRISSSLFTREAAAYEPSTPATAAPHDVALA